MKKLTFILVAVMFLFAACDKKENIVEPVAYESGLHKDAPVGTCVTTKMIAGGGTYDEDCTGEWVGNIYVTDDDVTEIITVTYEIIDGSDWVIDATHLYVGVEDGIPHNKGGNPKIGQFPYGDEYTVGQTSVTIIISGNDYPTGDYVVSAHAEVRDPSTAMAQFCENLPETAELVLTHPGDSSYFEATLTNAGDYTGVYPGWCIDIGHTISPGATYSLNLYCGYNGIPDEVDNPELLPLVNWLINQNLVGASDGEGGFFTMGDVQRAIWEIIDDAASASGLGAWSPTRVLLLHALVTAAGDAATNFEPEYGQLIAVIVDPIGNEQITIALMQFDAEGYEETAWGYGYCDNCDSVGDCHDTETGVAEGISFTDSTTDYGGSAWGWYFYGCPVPE